jgi:hypothetical protein
MSEKFKHRFVKAIPFLMGFVGMGALAYSMYREVKQLDNLDLDFQDDPMLKVLFDELHED